MKWDHFRNLFSLEKDYVHFACSMLSSHPKPVSDAIEYHRKEFDKNPAVYYTKRESYLEKILQKLASYLGASSEQIALTESTTMGLSLVYGGLQLTANDEVLTTNHEHYSALETLRFKALQTGCQIRQIKLYDNPHLITDEEILSSILNNINTRTRVVALTWVHSSTGLKLPIAKISNAIKSLNQKRICPILVCVDGVHAFGIEDFTINQLGCDFFISGCHKWLFGPRGTGFVWGTLNGWDQLVPIVPSFDSEVFARWRSQQSTKEPCSKARICTPGGFTAYEHRWALLEALDLHLNIGKAEIQQRVHSLAAHAKHKLRTIKSLSIYTPNSASNSSGLVCFECVNLPAEEIVSAMLKEKVVMGQTPYYHSLARWSLACYNTFEEIDRSIEILNRIVRK